MRTNMMSTGFRIVPQRFDTPSSDPAVLPVPNDFDDEAGIAPEVRNEVTRPMDVPDAVDDILHEDEIDPDTEFTEALGIVAEESESVMREDLGNIPATISPTVADEHVLRRLLSGKMLEALSWMLGNDGVSYTMYKRLSWGFNMYFKRYGERKYPSYGTILKMTYRMLQGAVFMQQHSVNASVNTSRSGVASRFNVARRRGNAPTTTFNIILPSQWGIKDLLQYDFLTSKVPHPCRVPTNLDVEHSALVTSSDRAFLSVALHESFEDIFGCVTGRMICVGSQVEVLFDGPSETVSALIRNGDCATMASSEREQFALRAGLQLGKLRGRLGSTTFYNEDDTLRDLHMCDAVTVLHGEEGSICKESVIVHRFSPPAGISSTFLSICDEQDVHHQLHWRQIRSIPESTPAFPHSTGSPFGILEDGRRYAVLRCLLYTDDFKPYSFRPSSCGGCYLLPLSISPQMRSGVRSIRILGLTPPGVSSNEAVKAITADIVQCSSEGIDVPMPDGNSITLFLDVAGYVGDYPAMAHLLDVTGVAGWAPCNFCTFKRANVRDLDGDDTITGEGSSFAYSTLIHSGNLSFRRTRERMRQARLRASPRDLQKIGLRKMDSDEIENLPLHRLSNALDEVRHKVPRTAAGNLVVPCHLDPYQSCFVGPDHVLFGVGQDITSAMLKTLNPKQRDHFNALSLDALSSVGFCVEGSFLAASSLHINQMSFSSFSTFLLVTPWAMRTAAGLPSPAIVMSESDFFSCSVQEAILHTLYLFQDLQFSTTHVPLGPVDGEDCVENMDGEKWHPYMQRLQEKVSEYVRKVNWLCKRSGTVRRDVDKPNIHRLLELYYQSIPRLGHVALFQELILESGHQPLKRGIGRSNKHAPHVHAMARLLADDWKNRIGEVVCEFEDLENITDSEWRALCRVAFGGTNVLDSGAISLDDLRRGFSSLVLAHLHSIGAPHSWKRSRRSIWVGKKRTGGTAVQTDGTVTSFLRLLLCDSANRNRFMVYHYATRIHLSEHQDDDKAMMARSRRAEQNTLRTGDVIQILVSKNYANVSSDANVVLVTVSEERGERSFWKILGFYGVSNKPNVYAHVHRMERVGNPSKFEQVFKEARHDRARYIVQLTQYTRRTLALHQCGSDPGNACQFSRRTGSLQHENDAPDSTYALVGSAEGFPPRLR